MKTIFINGEASVKGIFYTCLGQAAIEMDHGKTKRTVEFSGNGRTIMRISGDLESNLESKCIIINSTDLDLKCFSAFKDEGPHMVQSKAASYLADAMLAIMDKGFGLIDLNPNDLTRMAWKLIPKSRAFARGRGFVGIAPPITAAV